MRNVQASEAKARLAQLLDEVERGETVVITRHGRAIARIVPELDLRREEIRQSIERIKGLRGQFRNVTLKDLMDARHEGHRV